MSRVKERSSRYELNPKTIGEKAIEGVLAESTGEPLADLYGLREGRLKDLPFSDIFYDEFQILRMGVLSWEIQIPEEKKARYNLPVDSINSLGTTDSKGEEGEFYDFVLGANLMRGFIASAFIEQARIEKLPIPEINDQIIDAIPVEREELDTIYATQGGIFVFEAEELLDRWAQENPVLYNATFSLIDSLSERFKERTLRLYAHLPFYFLQEFAPEIHRQWQETLTEHALRAYAWFTPHPPELIEARVRRDRKKQN